MSGRSHVIAAFEARTGMDARAWLAKHGGELSLKQAAYEIGYSSPAHLSAWCRRNMPKGFCFGLAKQRRLTDDDLRLALELHDDGATWANIAIAYSCCRQTLWDACKRYLAKQQIPDSTAGHQPTGIPTPQ